MGHAKKEQSIVSESEESGSSSRGDPPPYSDICNDSDNQDENLESDTEQATTSTSSSKPKSERVELCSIKCWKVKNLFLRKVHCVLTAQGLVILLIISGFSFIPNVRMRFENMSRWKFWPIWLIACSLCCSITAFDRIMRKKPLNLILLAIITAGSGSILGSLAAYLKWEIVILVDVGIITTIALCVVIFTLNPWRYYTPYISAFFVLTLLGVAYGFLCIAFSPEASMYIIIGPTAFLIYAVVATHLVIQNQSMKLMSNEYVYGATTILMLLVAIFGKLFNKIPCCRPCVQICNGCKDCSYV